MMDANVLFAVLMVGTIGLMFVAGRIAERRGRSFKIWALIASMIGPLVFPLVYLFPNLHRKNGDHA